jgi:maltokinase
MAESYAADGALLAELRAAWPPLPSPFGGSEPSGHVGVDLDGRLPDAAIRLAARFAVALVRDGNGWLTVPLAGSDGRWWRAAPGDGLSAFVAGVPLAAERGIGVDQTNASVVVGERVVVKWFRRVGAGPSRAALLLAHLAAVGFAEIPAPLGSLAWRTAAGVELTIAQGDAFLPGARDGWEWVLERVERHVAHGQAPCPAACDPWVGAPLGRLVARLHAALRTESPVIPDPVGQADAATVRSWREAARANLREAIEQTADDVAGAALLERIEPGIATDLGALDAVDPRPGGVPIQPVHGDLHVGQVLEWSGGLALIDFDGNPAFGAAAHAIRQPVERDIAQLVSSIDHVGRVVDERTAGHRRAVVDEWIARTRREILAALDPDPALLAAFEAEQELRELVYAARFLPRWRYAPLATLRARYDA